MIKTRILIDGFFLVNERSSLNWTDIMRSNEKIPLIPEDKS
uniref:Uncharacterized protein n=1 Tax=Lepeophtheirus salmonis TaxID=72036 RepID=A0A0K2UB32_LEPSM